MQRMFDRLGQVVTRHWLLVILVWIIVALALKQFAPRWDDVTYDGDLQFLPRTMASVRGAELLNEAFPGVQAKSQLVVVVARPDGPALDGLARARVAVPGRNTTAFLLLSTLLGEPAEVVELRFDRIMPAVVAGEVDAGLVIHESRFTYADHGLRELADLGVLWERETGGPLPLGVIAARRDLGAATFAAVERALRDSVLTAQRDPARPQPWMRAHAQEMADEVQRQHVELYVNDFTVDLGVTGRAAIDELLRRGRAAGLLPPGGSAFREDV